MEEKELVKEEWKKLNEKAQAMEEQKKLDREKRGCRRNGKNLKLRQEFAELYGENKKGNES